MRYTNYRRVMDFDEIIKEQMNNVLDEEEVESLTDYAADLSNGISDQFYPGQNS